VNDLFGRGVGEFLGGLFGEGSHEFGILQADLPRPRPWSGTVVTGLTE
jgi:hypothetical protein